MAKHENPKIRFNSDWIPTHQAWSKLETAMSLAGYIEQFNERWPSLATDQTRTIVPKVRKQLKSIELVMPEPTKTDMPDMGETAAQLLEQFNPEETIQRLREDFGQALDLQALIAVVGLPAYCRSLANEVQEFRRNKISPEQTATLWNELGRPTIGGGTWTAGKVDSLLA